MQKELEVIEPVTETGLTKILTDSKLEVTDAEAIKLSYQSYFEQLGIIKDEASKINFENPSALDEKIARDLRLRTVKIRTGSEAIKEDRKKIHMLKANVEQSAWNLIKDTCKLDEERFLQVEKKREIAEAARLAERKTARLEALKPYGVDAQFVDLTNMPDEDFEKFLLKEKVAFDVKIEQAEKEAEEQRERERVAEEKRQETARENARLRAEAEAKEKELAEVKAKAEAERKAAEQEAARLKAEAEAKEKAERERVDREFAREKARVEAEQKRMREEAEKKLAAERAERERVEAELKAKAEAEAKQLAEQEAREQAELSKGDAAKLEDLKNDLQNLITKYEFKSKKHKQIMSDVASLLGKIINHIISKQ